MFIFSAIFRSKRSILCVCVYMLNTMMLLFSLVSNWNLEDFFVRLEHDGLQRTIDDDEDEDTFKTLKIFSFFLFSQLFIAKILNGQ